MLFGEGMDTVEVVIEFLLVDWFCKLRIEFHICFLPNIIRNTFYRLLYENF